jgi:hypothetical protein
MRPTEGTCAAWKHKRSTEALRAAVVSFSGVTKYASLLPRIPDAKGTSVLSVFMTVLAGQVGGVCITSHDLYLYLIVFLFSPM